MQFDAIGVGWDVGGWQGRAQAVAVVGWRRGQAPVWLGISPAFRLSSRQTPDLLALLAPALHDAALTQRVAASPVLTLGIDAPLAFPRALGLLLSSGQGPCQVPVAEIDNPYAYRECERWIYQRYGKKPLSASFDRLGNNATLAMALLPRLGLEVQPMQGMSGRRAAIEVYPALAKMAGKGSRASDALSALLPPDLAPGTHSYDAALCALMALQHASGNDCDVLPTLLGPQCHELSDISEGWIYHFQRAAR